MCGVVGIFPIKPKAGLQVKSKPHQELAIRFLLQRLLVDSQSRGTDASGFAVTLADGRWFVLKQPVAASDFVINDGKIKSFDEQVASHNMKRVMAEWRGTTLKGNHTKSVIGHVRKSSVGSVFNPLNNHPVVVEKRIIGVHNGTLKNDDVIFERVTHRKQAGDVDSEAIFHLQHALAADKEPTLELLQEIHTRLRGAYTTLSINTAYPNKIAVLRSDRPLVLVYLEGLDLVVAASELSIVVNSVRAYNAMVLTTGSELPLAKSTVSTTVTNERALILDLGGEMDKISTWGAETSLTYPRNKEYDEKRTVVRHSYGVIGNYTHKKSVDDTFRTETFVHATDIDIIKETEPLSTAPTPKKMVDSKLDGEVVHVEVDVDGGETPEEFSLTEDEKAWTEKYSKLLDEGETEALERLTNDDMGMLSVRLFSNPTGLYDSITGEGLKNAVNNFLSRGSTPTNTKTLRELVEELVCSIVMETTEVVYSEGYAQGYAQAIEDDTSDEDEETIQALGDLQADAAEAVIKGKKLSKKLSSSAKIIANLRTATLASLLSCQALGTEKISSLDGTDIIKLTIAEEIKDYAEYINGGFNEEALLASLNSGASEIARMVALIAEQKAVSEEESEEEEDETSDYEGTA